MPSSAASCSSSQSRDWRWRAQGEGWSAISSSIKVRRAERTLSELVETFIPSSAGRTQLAVRTRPPASTTHTRHTPAGVSFCWWHSVGIAIPFMRAASNTVVPAGTETGLESMVSRMDSLTPASS
jgi:hypothetical protein